MQTTQIRLAARPVGEPADTDFAFVTEDLPELADGQVLLRTLYLSLDPYMRGRMSAAKSYAEPVPVGGVMVGQTVCEVVKSRADNRAVGDVVLAYTGWQTFAVANARHTRRLDPAAAPVSTALGVLGMPGFTAYAGLLEIGRPQPGETVVVAAATGPVGSAVGQIAQLKGARSVGIAGGAEKVRALTEEFGFDVALDHRSPTFREDLAAATPDGIDVYFENVGGRVADEVTRRLNRYARIPVCGLVANYNATEAPAGPDRLPGFLSRVLTLSLTVRGFIQSEFEPTLTEAFQRDMTAWVREGKVRYREDVVEGLQNAPEAFRGLLVGRNFGKLLVKIGS
ncbi:NADP-dependent oxidoreductase [Nocardioides daeguensis]|uniref:NADP-dependent oxidoreductase n=1 Tax=Nocardioides daeguensis TaxID=908359 RepID=A0ABP6V590_9ACTN|nr:NADP-dependent oxidoreductase [Nocardioides daeguensis]MBV6729686.1 NADP-dependent oxidoreductase [Nocardioides daeguensis]MCR1774709.1 NADP-dependent oxidoreductase [Nocardioides daeguensis]